MYIELRIPSLIVCETMDQKLVRNHMHVVEKKYASGRVHKNHNLVCHAAISPKSSHCKQNQFCVPYLLLDVLYFICSFKKSVSLLHSHGTSSPTWLIRRSPLTPIWEYKVGNTWRYIFKAEGIFVKNPMYFPKLFCY
jgi:hypothetical protein